MSCSSRLLGLLVVLATPVFTQSAVCAAPPAPETAAAGAETGLAAVYSDRLNGHRTASGKRYRKNALTAAHKSLPFGTKVKVTHAKNHRSVILTVDDRGPTQAGRVVDISPAAAKKLHIGRHSMAEVSVEVVDAAPRRR